VKRMNARGFQQRVVEWGRGSVRCAARTCRRWFPGDPGAPTPEERELLASLGRGTSVAGFVRTGTAIDTGGWSGPRRICAVPDGDGLLLFAPGPRPFVRRIERRDIRLPQYHHGITELLLGVPGLPGLRLPVRVSHALLEPHQLQPANP